MIRCEPIWKLARRILSRVMSEEDDDDHNHGRRGGAGLPMPQRGGAAHSNSVSQLEYERDRMSRLAPQLDQLLGFPSGPGMCLCLCLWLQLFQINSGSRNFLLGAYALGIVLLPVIGLCCVRSCRSRRTKPDGQHVEQFLRDLNVDLGTLLEYFSHRVTF